MTPSISILTPFAPPTLDAHPLSASNGCHSLKRPRGARAPFGVPAVTGPGSVFISNFPGTTTTTTTTTVCTSTDAYDGAPLNTRQWTGMPIRAIVPLPRRCRPDANGTKSNTNGHDGPVLSNNENNNGTAKIGFGQPLARSAAILSAAAHTHYVWDEDEDEDGDDEDEVDHAHAHADVDAVDSGREMELDQGMNDKDMDMDDIAEGDGDDEDQSRSRCCSYESITAAEGLSAWSFEELRVECYAQSLIARGTRPPPVAHPSLTIPPAFAPRILLRIQPRSS